MKRKRDVVDVSSGESNVEILQWTEKQNTKHSYVTARRFLVKYQGLVYRISGRVVYGCEPLSLANLVITESTIDYRIPGQAAMDLEHKENMTTQEHCLYAKCAKYLSEQLSQKLNPSNKIAISEDVLEKEREEIALLRTYDDKRAEFYKSDYCILEKDNNESIPDTDSSINLSLCSGDTNFEVIGEIVDNIKKLFESYHIDLKEQEDNDIDAVAYYDEVSYRKALKLNILYDSYQTAFNEALPYFIYIHIAQIMEYIRIVHPLDQLQMKRIQFWKQQFDCESDSDQ